MANSTMSSLFENNAWDFRPPFASDEDASSSPSQTSSASSRDPYELGNDLLQLMASPQDDEPPLGVLPPIVAPKPQHARPPTPMPPTHKKKQKKHKQHLPLQPKRKRKSGPKLDQHKFNTGVRRRCEKLFQRFDAARDMLQQIRLQTHDAENVIDDLELTARELYREAGGAFESDEEEQ